MTTLASVGSMPALPLGMAYPRNWTPSKPGKEIKVFRKGKRGRKRKVVYYK